MLSSNGRNLTNLHSILSLVSLISEDAKLRYYDHSCTITLWVDASAIGLGACLIQDGVPVAYASKSLTAMA